MIDTTRLAGWKAPLLFAVCFALYFFTRSPALDEWDSVQFAMGVKEFNLWTHKPHPPGYPLYIFPAWIAMKLFGWEPNLSLHVVSCVGGAMFVAAWFLIARFHFDEKFGWLLAGTLAITPVVWMTSTKALTDSFAAGFLAMQLFYCLQFRSDGRRQNLVIGALLGAAATGARPQLLAVSLVILFVALSPRKQYALGVSAFVGGCLLWLIPTWYTQALIPHGVTPWLAYPAQLYTQWTSRLHDPYIYVGAGGFGLYYLAARFVTHILGWFGVALGFIHSPITIVLGATALLIAIFSSFKSQIDGAFWRLHAGWAALNVAIVFCCLPSDQRYYLIIVPLLLVFLLRAFVSLPGHWRYSVFALPILLFSISAPLAVQNHFDDPPPLKFVRLIRELHPPENRNDVLLFLTHSQRHFEYYAPEFARFEDVSIASVPPERLKKAIAIYTEEPAVTVPQGWHATQIAEFKRSIIIYRKHHDVCVYKVKRDGTP